MTTHKPIEINRELYGKLTIADEGKIWYVIYTKSKREKKLADYAYKNKINYYLPLIDSIKTYQYRKIKFTKAMFPGYIFVKCTQEEKEKLIISGHTVVFLNVKSEQELVDELSQIYFGRSSGAKFEQHPFVEYGTKVKIVSGPLKGMSGIVKDVNNFQEIILQVNMLRQAISAKVKLNQIKIVVIDDS